MIDRLGTTLGALAAYPEREIASPAHEALRRDCADAVRLQLDCMQAELHTSERHALLRLHHLLEEPDGSGAELAAAVRAALSFVA